MKRCVRAIGAVVARFVHTEEVTGSNPVSPTDREPLARPGVLVFSDRIGPRGNPLFHILFAGMTAKPLADAFFGMATASARLTQQEIAIRNVLRNAETGEPVPPASIRIKTVDGVPTLTNLGIGTNAIIAEINTLIRLVEKIQVFSRACRSKQRDESRTILGDFEVVEPSGDEPRTVVLKES